MYSKIRRGSSLALQVCECVERPPFFDLTGCNFDDVCKFNVCVLICVGADKRTQPIRARAQNFSSEFMNDQLRSLFQRDGKVSFR